jgi:DNA-binding transcriptional ArsR family regulator
VLGDLSNNWEWAVKERQEFIECAERLCAIADPTRLRIIQHLLLKYEDDVGTIAAGIGVTLGMASHHLHALKAAQLAASERRGRRVYYRLTNRSGDTLKIAGYLFTMAVDDGAATNSRTEQ